MDTSALQQRTKQRIAPARAALFALGTSAFLALATNAFALLPTPVAPSTAPAAGDYLGVFKGYAKDAGIILGLTLAILAFLWLGYATVAKFNEARGGRAEWAEVGLTGAVAAAVALFVGYFLTAASTII